MTDDNQAVEARHRAEAIAREADHEAYDAVQRIALNADAPTVVVPVWPGVTVTACQADARSGMRAAHRLKLAAGRQLRDSIRHARQDGIGWQEIGALLELGADAAECGVSLAGTAFGLAAGQPSGWGQVVTFSWRCGQCGRVINDRGPGHDHPADDEPGHAGQCPRLAAAVAGHDAAGAREH